MTSSLTLFLSHLLWFGDLNYRVPLPDNEAKAILQEENGIQKLLALDQLATEIRAGRAFYDFVEHPIRFLPTFKYDVGTDTFDTRFHSFIVTSFDVFSFFFLVKNVDLLLIATAFCGSETRFDALSKKRGLSRTFMKASWT